MTLNHSTHSTFLSMGLLHEINKPLPCLTHCWFFMKLNTQSDTFALPRKRERHNFQSLMRLVYGQNHSTETTPSPPMVQDMTYGVWSFLFIYLLVFPEAFV